MGKGTRRKSLTGRLPDGAQRALGLEVGPAPVAEAPGARAGALEAAARVRFETGRRAGLWVGDVPLSRYLEEGGFGWVVRLVDFLETEVDFGGFEAAYAPGGRPPLHPRLLVGLFVYGMLLRQWSLRELEALARRDVGGWWVCAGLTPDHSTLGRFALQHAGLLSEDFFLQVTQAVVRRLGLTPGTVAADGTVVEAASAMASTLKRAGLEARAREAQEAVAQATAVAQAAAPQDAQQAAQQRVQAAQAQVQHAQEALGVLAEREEARRQVGKGAEDVRLSPHEPQACVQPRKDGAVRPGYKPCVLVHQQRLILGQTLHPSSETAQVPGLLVQHGQVLGALPQRALLDAGFCTHGVLQLCVDAQLDALIPSGKAHGQDDLHKRGRKGRFAKADFVYDAAADAYRCPAGQWLTPGPGTQEDGAGRAHRVYRTAGACGACALRAQCTQATGGGRRLKRYAGDALKEAMQSVLTQPAARALYAQRQGIVEPVFAELKVRQGLTRFRRKGLLKVALEFALHCTAYNLKRAVRAGAPPAVLLRFVLFVRPPGAPWRPGAWALLLTHA